MSADLRRHSYLYWPEGGSENGIPFNRAISRFQQDAPAAVVHNQVVPDLES